MTSTKKKIENIKNQIVDSTLLIGIITGLAAFFVAYFPSERALYAFNFYGDAVSILILILIYIYRKRINVKFKATIIILVIASLVITDTMSWGIYSLNKTLIVIVPFYALFVFDFWKAQIIYFIVLMAYLSVGLLGLYNIQETSVIVRRWEAPIEWLESILILSVAALIIVIFTKKYNDFLSKLIEDLETKNVKLEEHEKELEQRNANLNSTLDDLQANNKKLAEYAYINSHLLRAPLSRMLGLANLVTSEIKIEKDQELLQHFQNSAVELDEVVNKINDVLDEKQVLDRNHILSSNDKEDYSS